jgi:acyl-CoA synthetase (NDP forming)
VAVLGASDRAGSVGGAVLRNIVEAGFTGAVHAVNRRRPLVAGVQAVASIDEIEAVELVVVAIPADAVVAAAEDCARRGARAIVVISDGFGEAGEEGRRRQRDLVTVCRRNGMRLVGPNCLGVMSTDPHIRLDASFAPRRPPPGRVAFLSQSGALAIAAADTARERELGLSSFVSVGNKADLSGNDFLAYWEGDPRTAVVLLYLESFGNPRKFARVARRVARTKPIAVVKGGRSAAGLQAAGSHTGALLAGSDATVQALFEQAGVIPTDTLGELFDVATLLADQPAPAGPRVGIVTNGGGLGILCADACAAAGLDVAALPEAVQRDLGATVAAGAGLRNPIDLLAAATPAQFEATVAALGASGSVDAVIAIYVPPMISDPGDVAAAILRGAGRAGVPVAAVLAMADPPRDARAGDGVRVPCFRLPENAAGAVARAARYGAWRAGPPDDDAGIEGEAGVAAAIVAGALARGPGWLEPEETAALLDAYGIARVVQRTVPSVRAAAAAAREIGFPVALKAVAPGLVHRTDAGAVQIGLRSAAAIAREGAAMRARLARSGIRVTGFVVQAMAPIGVEMLAGVVADPTFGPVVACAAGGTSVELLGDSAIRLTPLGRRRAGEMVRSLRTFPLLDGYRGAPRCDSEALVDLLVRLGALAEAHPEVAEIECNPVMVHPGGAVAVDARARVQQSPPRLPEPALRPA